MTEDEITRDLRSLASGRIAAMILIEVAKRIGPELEKLKFSPLGLRTGTSRYSERKKP